jgi:aminoglycoside phosphotransferase family enzyme
MAELAGQREPLLADKVLFLADPAAYSHEPPTVEVRETHMSWVFLAGDRVFKLKKPVRYPFLDFSTLARRKHFVPEEVRLNRRLAPASTWAPRASPCAGTGRWPSTGRVG